MARLRRGVRLAVVVGLLLALALAGWAIAGQLRAWRSLEAAREALARDEAVAAQRLLEPCLRLWPDSGEVQFLAAQAARRTGELAEAMRRLSRAGELGWVGEAIDLERALLRVQTGDLAGAERYLMRCVEAGHPDAALILEILTPAYTRNFQLAQAAWCVDAWLEQRPDSAAAHHAKGLILERQLLNPRAADSYREAVRLAPERPLYRAALVRVLNKINRPEEAREHAEKLLELTPNDLEAQLQLARALVGLGEREQATARLDALLRHRPEHGEALFLRGKIELERGQPQRAAELLRRAVEQLPIEPAVLYTWLRCLQQAGTPAEVESCQKRLMQVEADLARLRELTKGVMASPKDAERRCEIGAIYLRNGKHEEGLRWLNSALAAQPGHSATHRLLAEHYRQTGRSGPAERHRRLADEAAPAPRR